VQKLAHKEVTLPAGATRLVVVADTHSLPHADAYRHIAAKAPDAIVHAGDIGELDVLAELEKIAPVLAIRGNIDTKAHDLPDVLVIDHGALRILVVHIGVYGPKLRAEVAKRARDEGARLVVCGHSHVPFIGIDRGLYVFNPGSIGPRRFALPIVFGTIELASTIKLAHVDCETGAAWSPP
jgi:putative phosphoesterase